MTSKSCFNDKAKVLWNLMKDNFMSENIAFNGQTKWLVTTLTLRYYPWNIKARLPKGVTPLRIHFLVPKTLNSTTNWLQLIVESSFPVILAHFFTTLPWVGMNKLWKLKLEPWLPPHDICFSCCSKNVGVMYLKLLVYIIIAISISN